MFRRVIMASVLNDHDFISPIPSFIDPFPEDYFREFYEERLSLIGFHPNNSDFGVKLNDALLYITYLAYVKMAYLVKGCFVDYAQGLQLDELVKLAGISRKQATPPVAKALIKSKTVFYLPPGTQFVSDQGDLAYLMTGYTVTPEGTEVVLESPKEGKIDINTTATVMDNIESVQMLGEFQKLSEEEDDEQLRSRFKKALARFSTAGSKQTYEYYAISVPGVKQATAYNNGAGKVLIVYDGRDLLADVIQKNLKPVTPMTDSLTVKKATEVAVNPTITLFFNPDADVNYIQSSISDTLQQVFSKIKIGENIPIPKFYSYITGHKEVYSSEPDEDTLNKIKTVDPHSILKLQGINFVAKYRGTSGL